MDEERTTDDQQTGDTTQQEDRHGTPFGLESSIPGVGVHGAEDEHERAPSTKARSSQARRMATRRTARRHRRWCEPRHLGIGLRLQ